MKGLRNDLTNQLQDRQEPNIKSPGMVEPEQPMPIKVKPYLHQIIGYNLACRILGIFEGGG